MPKWVPEIVAGGEIAAGFALGPLGAGLIGKGMAELLITAGCGSHCAGVGALISTEEGGVKP